MHLRHDGGDGFGRTAFASRDHNEHLHDAVVGLVASALNDEDILISN